MAKILIVDDSALSRRILRRILEAAGHEVLEAESGAVALERYFLEKPALMFLDMNMVDMHGLEVLTKLRQMDSTAKVIVATADIQSSTRTLTKEQGASGFINKPFEVDAVLSMIDAVLS